MYKLYERMEEKDTKLKEMGEGKKKEAETLINNVFFSSEHGSIRKWYNQFEYFQYNGFNYFWIGNKILETKGEDPFTRKERREIYVYANRKLECIHYFNDENQKHSLDEPAIYSYNTDGSVRYVGFCVRDLIVSKQVFDKIKNLEKELDLDRKKVEALMDVITSVGTTIADRKLNFTYRVKDAI